jgi:hypothetical protein
MSRTTLLSILAANLFPLLAVLLFDWQLADIMLLYWLENGIIGALNAVKILLAQGEAPTDHPIKINGKEVESTAAVKWFLVPFFFFHYGLFWIVHGVFVFTLFVGEEADGGMSFVLAVIALSAAHLIAFVRDYLKPRLYLDIDPGRQMFQPYGRVLVLHMAILLGGGLVMLLNAPIFGVLLLIGLKIAFESRFLRY